MSEKKERFEIIRNSKEFIFGGDLTIYPPEKESFWKRFKNFLFYRKRVIEIDYSIIEGEVHVVSPVKGAVFVFRNLKHVKGNMRFPKGQEIWLPSHFKCDGHMWSSSKIVIKLLDVVDGYRYCLYHGITNENPKGVTGIK